MCLWLQDKLREQIRGVDSTKAKLQQQLAALLGAHCSCAVLCP
jgi:hypothetical protein